MKAEEAFRLSVMNRKSNTIEFAKDKYMKYILKGCRREIKENVNIGNFSAEFLFSSYYYGLTSKSIPQNVLNKNEVFMKKLKEQVVEPLRRDGYDVSVDGFMWPSIKIGWHNAGIKKKV